MRATVADEMVRRMLGLRGDYYYSSKNFKDWSDIRKSIGIPKQRGKKTNPS
jgi:hypothetical protein